MKNSAWRGPRARQIRALLVSFLTAWTALASLTAWTALASAKPEPTTPPPPFLSIAPGQLGARLQVNFPAESHADETRSVYWLSGSERLVIDVQLLAGADEPVFPIDVRGALLLDGRQAGVAVDGARSLRTIRRSLAVPGGVDRFVVSLPGSAVARGIHTADLIFWRADGVPFPCWSFFIVKDEAKARRLEPASAFVRQAGAEGQSSRFSLSSTPRPLFGPLLSAAPNGDEVTLRVHLEQPSSELGTTEFSLVGVLDDEQISFERVGRAPTVALLAGEMADGELTLKGLSANPDRNHLLFFFLVRRPTWDDRSLLTTGQAFPTRQVGGLSW